MEEIERFLEAMENDPELRAVKARLTRLEVEIRRRVGEEAWELLLEWESEWAHYVTICTKRLYPLAYKAGWDAHGEGGGSEER